MGSMNYEYSELYSSDDLVGAADTLIFMKRQKLSNDEATQLDNMMAEDVIRHHYQRRRRNTREEVIMNSIVPENLTAERDHVHHHHQGSSSRNNREEDIMNSTVREILMAERDHVHHHYQRRSRNNREEEIMNVSTVPENLMAERDHVHHHHHHQGSSSSNNSREEAITNSTVPEDFPVPSLRQFVKQCSVKAIEKQLTSTDTKDEHNRLNLVKCLAEQYFLPMLNEDEHLQRGIPVTTYDENGNEYAMKFVLWSNKYYVLNGGWKQFCKRRELQPLEDYVQVWMFRHSQTDKLCFVITHRRKPLLQPLRIGG